MEHSWVGLCSQLNLSWPTMRCTPRDMDHSWTERAPSSNQLILGYLLFGFMNDQIILADVDTAFVVWSTIGGRVRVVGTLVQIMTANLFLKRGSRKKFRNWQSGIKITKQAELDTSPWKPVNPGLQGHENEPTLQKLEGLGFLYGIFSHSNGCVWFGNTKKFCHWTC